MAWIGVELWTPHKKLAVHFFVFFKKLLGFIYQNASAPYSIVGIAQASYNWEYIS